MRTIQYNVSKELAQGILKSAEEGHKVKAIKLVRSQLAPYLYIGLRHAKDLVDGIIACPVPDEGNQIQFHERTYYVYSVRG